MLEIDLHSLIKWKAHIFKLPDTNAFFTKEKKATEYGMIIKVCNIFYLTIYALHAGDSKNQIQSQ